MADFRSERMPSPEGEGRAKETLESAYETYYKANKSVNRRIFGAFPELRTLLRGYASARMFDLFGFWVIWHLSGGFEGMQKSLGISRTGVFRRVAQFREVFGEHPDVYEFPGITIDPAAFNAGMVERQAKK
jgi:hypothetical protein